MMSDLRAKVEALKLDGASPLRVYGYKDAVADVLALIPEGAVLVTEETLASALEIDWSPFWVEEPQTLSEYASGTTTVHFDRDAFAAAIIAKLREGT